MFGLLLAATIAIPNVEHHPERLTLSAVHAICEKWVREEELPCSVVTTEEEVCFSFMDAKGQPSTVHCFIKREET